jgi:hypothetical protein
MALGYVISLHCHNGDLRRVAATENLLKLEGEAARHAAAPYI